MKILIAIPCMDMVAAAFSQSLAMLHRVGQCYVMHMAGSLVYDARNKLAAKAVELECDYVMWFDSDMVFDPDTLEKLIAHDKDIVTGIYHRRSGSYKPVLFKELTDNGDGTFTAVDYLDYPTDGLFKVAGMGFGCVLMKTSVLFDMAVNMKDWFTPNGRIGEDLSFCHRATQLGYEIWADPSIRLGHVGNMIITKEFYNAYKSAEAQHESKS